MARNVSYMLNLYHTSKYVIENGSINTFSNMPDDGLFVEKRLSYEGLLSKICMTLGWDPAHVKLHLSLVFDSPGGRRIVKIKNNSHAEFMNRVDLISFLDLYIYLEDFTQEEREASLENVSFCGFPRRERAGGNVGTPTETPQGAAPPFRDQLTSLRVEDFRWQPYAKVLYRLPDFCTQGQAIWTTRCWMFCWATREPHESGRVVRQFGYIQDVPKRHMIKDNASFLPDHAHSMSGYPSNNWVDHHSAVRRHWNRREEYVLCDLEEGDPGSEYERYYEWFMVNTGDVLNNIRVSSEKFREKREDENLLDEELDKHLDNIINQTHVALTLGANDEMDVEDTQILVDEDPSLPSQPPPGKKAKPWSRDKIGGRRKRKVPIPSRTSQQQTEGQQNEDQAHSSQGSRIQVDTQFEDIQFGGQSQPQPGVKFLTMEESHSQPQPEPQFGGQSQPQQSSILTYLKRGDRLRYGPNKYTLDAHNKGKRKK
ncbi:OLC1v1004836C1 [Oldenlandia corymbosa var. corymbosa]|uniref:OLC1v1004836C1 n=1 Tax=Oldenlandia corymbosa var. corymbosa TaxID=529605 RepID=A0AAV1DGQ0_OLDCO|nr:OLC1v1004836C1 [Oldenlandia corymbosa var. corymbosa]